MRIRKDELIVEKIDLFFFETSNIYVRKLTCVPFSSVVSRLLDTEVQLVWVAEVEEVVAHLPLLPMRNYLRFHFVACQVGIHLDASRKKTFKPIRNRICHSRKKTRTRYR